MHFDHIGGVTDFAQAFPAAKFYVQKKELDFSINSPISQKAAFKPLQNPDANKAFAELAKGPRVVKIDGDKVIAPQHGASVGDRPHSGSPGSADPDG